MNSAVRLREMRVVRTKSSIARKNGPSVQKPRGPFRRFECFFPESDSGPDPEDLFLNDVAHKITLIALQISRVENRLSDYETRTNDELVRPHVLREIPPPRQLPSREKSTDGHMLEIY
jgi:hypothetical protein